MSESKHTPGPWAVWIDQRDGQPRVTNGDENGAVVCYLPVRNSEQRRPGNEANARLIAAAPDLLAELKYLVAHCKGLDRFEGNPINQAISDARAAIAKAEGK